MKVWKKKKKVAAAGRDWAGSRVGSVVGRKAVYTLKLEEKASGTGRPRRNIGKKKKEAKNWQNKEEELLENGGLREEKKDGGEERGGCGEGRPGN